MLYVAEAIFNKATVRDTETTLLPMHLRQSSVSSSGDDDSLNSDPDQPVISKLFTDAALYNKFLDEQGCTEFWSTQGGDSSIPGFADLVAAGLSSPEKAITGRLAKLSVKGDSWVSSETTSEPESYDTDSETDESSGQKTLQDEVQELERLEPTPVLPRSSTLDGEKWKLEPDEIVNLLVEEFGPLAAEGEQENLIIEADGAFFHQDVVILGVIHLTTHRLAFHASLLATRPDLSPRQQVIRAGPAVIRHNSRWRRKRRRVWLEISHDMLSSYSSSRDEDHIQPIRTVLYSNVKEVLRANPKRPRIVEVIFDASTTPSMNGVAEFDTVESACEWRKELQGALYLYRHGRRQALGGDSSDELNGVRLSIPLSRIDRMEEARCLTFTYLLSIYVPFTSYDTHSHQAEKIQFVTLQPDDAWKKLQQYIDAAKERQLSAVPSDVVVDFGPLSFLEKEDHIQEADVEKGKETAIRRVLALGHEATLWISRARIHRSITSAGYFVVSPNFVGFWSKTFALSAIRYRLSMSIIKEVNPVNSKVLRFNCLAVVLEGQSDLLFDFKTAEHRDQAIDIINAALETLRSGAVQTSSRFESSSPLSESTLNEPLSPTSTSSLGWKGPNRSAIGIFSPLSRTMATVLTEHLPIHLRSMLPKAINVPRDTLYIERKMHFVCLTIGSRGDVQPYIALGLGLQKEGHRVTIVTHEEYKEWIVGFGIEHRTAGGDPGALMKLSVENKMFSPEFFKESLTNFRPWLDQLLVDAWEQCQGADVLLESPSAMAGVHIAEALNIPYFRCFTMPWTKTTQFPHAFLSPPVESPTFNSASYVLFENVMWTATSGQINKWRRKKLKIGNTDMGHLAQSKITFIYNFSPAVVPKPLDWADTTVVSGYWFLDNPDHNWTPPPSLTQWMDQARKDGKAIVYIGFGSITVPHPRSVTERIIKAVLKSDVRAIVSKGWSSRMSKKSEPDIDFPPECYPLEKVPHDWLFPQIDAALHHGGAGTTGASLRAGIPTLIKPWFGDQYFWASRVHKLGAGLKVPNLRVNELADALTIATTSRIMKEKAASVGEKIRAEDGVHNAIYAIYTYLPRASRDRASLDRSKD